MAAPETKPSSPLRDFGRLLLDHWVWWVVPTVVMIVLFAVLALWTFSSDTTFNYTPF